MFSTGAGEQARLWPEGAPRPAAFLAQRGEDLGARVAAAFEDLFAGGARAAVIVGSDHPTLPATAFFEAFDALAARDVVLGPTFDGGYYLVGMTRLHRGLFVGIPWSTPGVLAATLDRVEAAGLGLAVLGPWHDVDTPEDLRFLAAHLRALHRAGRGSVAPATAAALRGLGLLPPSGA